MMVTPHNRGGGSSRVGGGGASADTPDALRAWLFEVDQDGASTRMRDHRERCLKKGIRPGAALEIGTEGGQDTPWKKYLKLPRADGMAAQPVTVAIDEDTGFWMIRNNGSTNTLRVQQYALGAVPLHPGASIAMSGEDVAVWIPVQPTWPQVSDKGEAFRLLLLRTPRLSWKRGATTHITGPDRGMTSAMQEALIMYFGQHLSWPPLVAPHVRREAEVRGIAVEVGLVRASELEKWARNRHDVLAGKDGLFTAADWYPQIGGPQRALANHLAAFHRLVERRTITLARAALWAKEQKVTDFISIDSELAGW
jgi:hypothetical protein